MVAEEVAVAETWALAVNEAMVRIATSEKRTDNFFIVLSFL
jgi:hypothetical protein